MKIKAQGTLYDFPSRALELGEQRRLKREFGLVPGRDELDLRDPDHLGAFLYSAMREANPDAPASSLLAQINRIREIEIVDDDGRPLRDDELSAEDLDPTEAPASPAVSEQPAGG